MNQVARVFEVPMIATEQYPEKLGQIVPEIKDNLPRLQVVYEKTMFSMMTEEVKKSLAMQPERHNIILYGIETHVCVQQTAMDALEMGYNVHVLVDGVSSQRALDRSVAIKKMSDLGVSLTTTESIIFEIMRDQQHPKFKSILPTLKVPRGPQFDAM